jgi:hypothetical protein
MKSITISIEGKELLEVKKIEDWQELTWQQIAHVLSVFNMPMPAQWSKETRERYRNLQILKAINQLSDEDLEHWRDTYLEKVQIQSFADSHIITYDTQGREFFPKKLAYYEWLEDLKNVADRSIEFAITKNTEGEPYINAKLYKNPLPILNFTDKKGVKVKLYAGYSDFEDPFRDATLDELGRIYTLIEKYQQTQDETFLNEMIAVIYRLGKPRVDRQNEDNDDPRQPLEKSQKLLRVRVAIVRDNFQREVKEMIKLHVVSAMERMKELYPSIFTAKSNSGKASDFLDFILELADYKPLDTEGVSVKNAHDMLELAVRSTERNKQKLPKND